MEVRVTRTVVLKENIAAERSPGLVVGMLAAENPPMDGHLAAATPRRRGNASPRSTNFQMDTNLPKCLTLLLQYGPSVFSCVQFSVHLTVTN